MIVESREILNIVPSGQHEKYQEPLTLLLILATMQRGFKNLYLWNF